MSDSVLDRIRKSRQRPSVPARDDPLITKAQQTESTQDPEVSETLPAKGGRATPTSNVTLEELKAELSKFPETNRHSAIVLEKELDQALTRYCKDNRITVEVFLEAAWVYASSNSSVMEEILTEAKSRYADRKRVGKLRRLITMIEGKS